MSSKLKYSLAVVMLVALVTSAGCNTGKRKTAALATTSASVIDTQEAKDVTITNAADRIDIAAPQSAVRVETDIIRAAVKAAPASDVRKILDGYQARIAKLENETARWFHKFVYTVSIFGVFAGVALMFLGNQIPFAGPAVGGAVAAGSVGVFILGYVYEFASKHAGYVFAAFGIAGGLALANVWWHYQKKKETTSATS